MTEPIRSRPYSTNAACEKCVFGRGAHAEWCQVAAKILRDLAGVICRESVLWHKIRYASNMEPEMRRLWNSVDSRR